MSYMQIKKQQFFVFLFILFFGSSVSLGHGFGAYTLVHIADGSYEEIGQLCRRVFDKKIAVQSYDADIRLSSNATIKRCGKSVVDHYVRFSFSEFLDDAHDKIVCTSLQTFYSITAQDWVAADTLQLGDELLCKSGIKSVKRIEHVYETLEVYALHVARPHTFFVGHHGALTHNMALPALLSLGVSIPFGSVAAGTVGSFFGPVTLVAGAVIGSLVGGCIAMIQRDSIPSYEVPIHNVNYVDAFTQKGEELSYETFENDRYNILQNQSSVYIDGGMFSPMPQGPKKDDGDKKFKTASMPTLDNKQKLNHIFKKEYGHREFSQKLYNEMQELVQDAANYLGLDQYGKHWFGKILENGEQMWATAQKGEVISAGINEIVAPFCPIKGLQRIKLPKPTIKGLL